MILWYALYNCSKQYSVLTLFSAHISGAHRNINIDEMKDFGRAIPPQALSNEPAESSASSDFDIHIPANKPVKEPAVERGKFEEQFTYGIAQSLLKLQEVEYLPVSTLGKVVEEMKINVALTMDFTKASVLSILRNGGVNECIQESVAQNSVNNIFISAVSIIDTPYKRNLCFEKQCPMDKPVAIGLGKNSQHKTRTCQYVPVMESLKNMLKTEDILSAVMTGNHTNSQKESILLDFRDGTFYKESNFFLCHLRVYYKWYYLLNVV